MKAWFLAFVCLAVWPLFGDEKGVSLIFLPDLPVTQTSKVELERIDKLPGFNLKENASQLIESIVILNHDSEMAFPADLTFILKKIEVDLIANQTKAASGPIHLREALKRYVDYPFKIRLDEHYNIQSRESSLVLNLPIFGEVNLEGFFNEWFQHLFALSGRELFEGSTYKISFSKDSNPSTFLYTITSIDEYSITANISGSIDSRKIILSGGSMIDPHAELLINAKIEGSGCWNRKNALICQLQTTSKYTGKLQIENGSWNLEMNLNHQFESCEKCISKSE